MSYPDFPTLPQQQIIIIRSHHNAPFSPSIRWLDSSSHFLCTLLFICLPITFNFDLYARLCEALLCLTCPLTPALSDVSTHPGVPGVSVLR